MDLKDLEGKKLPELRELAKASNIQGFQTMKKGELLAEFAKLALAEVLDEPTAEKDVPSRQKRARITKRVEQPNLFEPTVKPSPIVEPKEVISEKTIPEVSEVQPVTEKPNSLEK